MFGYEFTEEELQTTETTETPQPSTSWNISWSGFVGAVKTATDTAVSVIKEDLTEIAGATQELAKESGLKDVISKVKLPATGNQEAENNQFALDEYVDKLEKFTLEGINKLGTGVAKGLNGLMSVGSTENDSRKSM